MGKSKAVVKYPWIAEKLRGLASPVAGLVADPGNARVHDEANLGAIEASLTKFGQVAPLVCNRRNRQVVIGNGRLKVAVERLGWSHLAVVWRDLDEAEQRALSIADNRAAELAEWDPERLEIELSLMEAEDGDLYAALLLADLLEEEEAEPEKRGLDVGATEFRVIVVTDGEAQQASLIARLESEGYKCQPLMS